MAEYIEKQAAIKELCETYEHEYPTASGAFDEYATRIVPNVLRNLPPADVRPVVRGRWVPVTNGRGGHECSECHEYAPSYQSGNEYLSRFCPGCGSYNGADMRGGDAE